MKTHKQLTLPETTAWDKKTYDPIAALYYKLRYEKEREIPSFLEKCLFDPYFSVKYFIKDLFDFFVRLYKWIPVIWKDRDWDDSFVFKILKHKLLTQREYIVKNNRHLSVEEINRDITICLNLIERILDNYYPTEYLDYIEEDHQFIPTDETNKYYTLTSTPISDNSKEYIQKYPNAVKSVLKKHQDLSNYETNYEDRKILCLYMSAYRHKKAVNLLFYILREKIESWWD